MDNKTPPPELPTRRCRFCLEDVPAAINYPHPGLPHAFQRPKLVYAGEDPSLGPLIKPCLCKGSGRYIHEGCLRQWRESDPGRVTKCSTCGYKFRSSQDHRMIASRPVQALLTLAIFFFIMFLLGFVADPVISLYADTYNTLADQALDPLLSTEAVFRPVNVDEIGAGSSWLQHFMKGLSLLGVVSFFKVMLVTDPWNFWNLRGTGLLGGRARAGNTGRDRVVTITWIAIGVGSALYYLFQQVHQLSELILLTLGNSILDNPLPDDEDDFLPPTKATESAQKDRHASPSEIRETTSGWGIQETRGTEDTEETQEMGENMSPTSTTQETGSGLAIKRAASSSADDSTVAVSTAVDVLDAPTWSFSALS